MPLRRPTTRGQLSVLASYVQLPSIPYCDTSQGQCSISIFSGAAQIFTALEASNMAKMMSSGGHDGPIRQSYTLNIAYVQASYIQLAVAMTDR